MTPPILTNEGVIDYLRVLEGKVGIPDHHNMAIFQLADKFTLTKTFTFRLVVCRTEIVFHAGASRKLIFREEDDENGGKVTQDVCGRLYM